MQAVQGIVEGYKDTLEAALDAALNPRKLAAGSPAVATSAGTALPARTQVIPLNRFGDSWL